MSDGETVIRDIWQRWNDGRREYDPEIIELADHPYFVASQFHPEFNSRPTRPEPLFREFVGAAARHAAERGDGPATEETEVEEQAVAADVHVRRHG